MNVADATLVTTEVEPGWPLTADHVPLGKHYLVDLDRIASATIVNRETGQSKHVACIWVVAPGKPGWLPALAFGMRTALDDPWSSKGSGIGAGGPLSFK